MKRRLFGLVLALCMVVTLMPTVARAERLQITDRGGQITFIEIYSYITENTTTLGQGWWVLDRDVTTYKRFTIEGQARIVLTKGCTLTLDGNLGGSVNDENEYGGITVERGAQLYVYVGQGGGKIVARAKSAPTGLPYSPAGIGGRTGEESGIIFLYDGTVIATGGGSAGGGAAGIGGGKGEKAGEVLILRSIVNASGSPYGTGDGIGGGMGADSAKSDNITISAGIVTATSTHSGSSPASYGVASLKKTDYSTLLFADSIGNSSDRSNWRGLIFEGKAGKVYGETSGEKTIPSGYTVTVDSGETLNISSGKITNEGTIVNNGTINKGSTFINNGLVSPKGLLTGNGELGGTGTPNAIASVSTAPEAIAGQLYQGSAIPLVTEGIASGGAMRYRLGESGDWSENVPTATNVGSDYQVFYKALGDATHWDSGEQSVMAAIGKATPSITEPQAITGLKYTGGAQELVTAGATSGGTMQYALSQDGEYSPDIPKGTDATDYTVWYKVVGGDNFDDVVDPSMFVNVSIGKSDSQAGNLTVGNGTMVTNTFAYGDTVTVTFTPAAATLTTRERSVTQNQAALMLGDKQLAFATPDASGKYTLRYDTANKDIPLGASTLTLQYGGSSDLNATQKDIDITLTQKTVFVDGVQAEDREYKKDDLSVKLDFSEAYVSGRVGTDDVTFTHGNAYGAMDSDAVQQISKKVHVNGVELTGNDAAYYTLDMQLASVHVYISRKTVSNPTITVTPSSYAFTNSAITPDSVVVKDGEDIIPPAEYRLSYDNNINVSDQAKVIVTNVPMGNYTVNGSTTFSITKGASQLGGMTLFNGATQTDLFTYGDTITASFTPAVKTRDALEQNQAALFLGETQLTTAVAPDPVSGKFTLTYDTAGKGVPIGESKLAVKYGGSNNLNATEGEITVRLERRGVEIYGATPVSREYAPKDTAITFDYSNVTMRGRIGTDDVTPAFDTATVETPDIGLGKAVTVSGKGLAGADSRFYELWWWATDSMTVDVTSRVVTSPTITITPGSYTFTGSAIKPTTVVVKDGNQVIPPSEYTLAYANNVQIGTKAQVIVTDVEGGNYTVNGSKYFAVTEVPVPPKTGDSAAPLAWLTLLLLGGCGVLALRRRRRA